MTHGMEDKTGKKLVSENKLQLWRWRLLVGKTSNFVSGYVHMHE